MNSRNISSNEQKTEFENLKSDFIFKKIISFMERNKSLNIMKYNKKLQKRLNININDYRKSAIIEIELKLDNDKYAKFSTFINIFKKDKEYYHIYFDNSNKEIKRNYFKKNEKVKMIKIIIDYPVKSFKELFFDCDCIESIFFKKFYRNNITDMKWMFYECSSLKELNLSNFNTNNVTDMSYMFDGCILLKELNLSKFNTNNVTDMSYMFNRCSSLKELNLSNFYTNNVTNMDSMFYECSSLKELNLSNFNTNNVRNMNFMFFGCSSLKELNLSNFNTNNVTNMSSMFEGCSNKLKNKFKKKNKNIFI